MKNTIKGIIIGLIIGSSPIWLIMLFSIGNEVEDWSEYIPIF